METIAAFHFPLKAGFLISDMNRADLDWKNGGFAWRYENKLTVERTFSIRSYHLIPYIAAEPYYESRYHQWSTTALYAGLGFPVGKHVVLNTYYEHQNNTSKSPNQQTELCWAGSVSLLFSGQEVRLELVPRAVWVLHILLVPRSRERI